MQLLVTAVTSSARVMKRVQRASSCDGGFSGVSVCFLGPISSRGRLHSVATELCTLSRAPLALHLPGTESLCWNSVLGLRSRGLQGGLDKGDCQQIASRNCKHACRWSGAGLPRWPKGRSEQQVGSSRRLLPHNGQRSLLHIPHCRSFDVSDGL